MAVGVEEMVGALLVLLSLAVRKCSGQDDGGGGGGEDLLDMESMLDSGDMGGGADGGGPGGGKETKKSLRLQTLLALQELGIVIGVAIMVAAIFMLMVRA